MNKYTLILLLATTVSLVAAPPAPKKDLARETDAVFKDAVISAYPEADILELSKRANRVGDFTSSSRNPFAAISREGGTTNGPITAEVVWDFIKVHLPVVGVNLNNTDQTLSTIIMGDVELTVGKPLPKYVLDAPVDVVLTTLSPTQATFRIIITDPNQNADELTQIHNFTLKFDGLVPAIQNTSKYVNLPLTGTKANNSNVDTSGNPSTGGKFQYGGSGRHL